jgi:DNA-directed RNA polymerase specialized sigma24 family protein
MNEQVCEELVRAAREGDAEASRRALGKLFPDVAVYVRAMMRGELGRIAAGVGWRADEVTAVVAEKLLKSGLRGDSSVAAVATVKAWVRRVAFNAVIDQDRKRKTRRTDLTADDAHFVSRDPSADDSLEATVLAEGLLGMLQECYPRGVPLFDDAVREGRDDDATLAERWGTTVANVQRQRTRMRRYCAAYQALSAGDALDDEAVVRKMDAEMTDETRRIIASVRHHLAARRRKH